MVCDNNVKDNIYCAENTIQILMKLILFGNQLIDLNLKKLKKPFGNIKKGYIFASAIGEMAEWSNALVLKTSEGHTSGGSNPSFSAKRKLQP